MEEKDNDLEMADKVGRKEEKERRRRKDKREKWGKRLQIASGRERRPGGGGK